MKNGKMLPLGNFVSLLLFRAERVHLNGAGTDEKKNKHNKKSEQVAAGAFEVNLIRWQFRGNKTKTRKKKPAQRKNWSRIRRCFAKLCSVDLRFSRWRFKFDLSFYFDLLNFSVEISSEFRLLLWLMQPMSLLVRIFFPIVRSFFFPAQKMFLFIQIA